MKKFLLFLLLATSLSCIPHHDPPLTAIVEFPSPKNAIAKSVARLTTVVGEDMYTCTVFSIESRIFLTADHCVNHFSLIPNAIMRVNEIRAFILAEDPVRDLAIIISDLNLPPVKFRPAPPITGEQVHAIGFGLGFTAPVTTYHIVELVNYRLSDDIYPGTIFLYPFIGGMSGGPVYDKDGLVIGVVQRTSPNGEIGYGVGVNAVVEFLESVK